mmetsp:Transcript_200/g.633  ORF Transcript_200/g.633 Transcript_200/m.633 type:complete len:225 (-) Transcript_200:42-716(-)
MQLDDQGCTAQIPQQLLRQNRKFTAINITQHQRPARVEPDTRQRRPCFIVGRAKYQHAVAEAVDLRVSVHNFAARRVQLKTDGAFRNARHKHTERKITIACAKIDDILIGPHRHDLRNHAILIETTGLGAKVARRCMRARAQLEALKRAITDLSPVSGKQPARHALAAQFYDGLFQSFHKVRHAVSFQLTTAPHASQRMHGWGQRIRSDLGYTQLVIALHLVFC